MDSSPTSSPTTSRFFKAYSTGPPKRTYSRRGRNAVVSGNQDLASESERDSEQRHGATSRRRSDPVAERDVSPSPSPRSRQHRRQSSEEPLDAIPVRRTRSSQKAREDSGDVGPSRATAPGPSNIKRRRVAPAKMPLDPSGSQRPESATSDPFSASDDGEAASTRSRIRTPSPPPSPSVPQTPPRSASRAKLPRTPSSASPGDFAEMFAAISPRASDSPHGTPRRTKKLLGKSHSSGAVLDSPSKLRHRLGLVQPQERFGSAMSSSSLTPTKVLGKSASMPITPSKSSPHTIGSDADPLAILMTASVPEGQGSGGRAKRVYGRTRTVVAEDQTLAATETLEEQLSRQSYADLRKRYEVNREQGTVNPDDFPVLARAPQSVNDMRSKGENRRYMDETGYLLDSIVDPGASKGLKRSGCVDLLESMVQDEWLAKMKICDLTERVWSAFRDARGAGDELMDAVCLLALSIIVRSGDGIDIVIRIDGDYCVKMVLDQMRQVGDLLSVAKSTLLTERVRAVGRRAAGDIVQNTAASHLASTVMSAICCPEICREAKPALQAHGALSKMSKLVAASGKVFAARFRLCESGLELLPHDNVINLPTIKNILAIADSLFLDACVEGDGIVSGDAAGGLLNLLIAMTALSLSGGGEDTVGQGTPRPGELPPASASVSHILKTYANMTHVAPAAVPHLRDTSGAMLAVARVVQHRALFATDAPLAGEGTTQGVGPDEILSLALAILTSACLGDSEVAKDIASLPLEPNCTGQGPCLRACRCPEANLFAAVLAKLYSEYISASSTPDIEIVGAYLALLLTKMITSATGDKELIIGPLPGDTRLQKLQSLSSSLDDLESFRALLDRRVKDMVNVEDDGWQDDQGVVRQAIADLSNLVEEAKSH